MNDLMKIYFGFLLFAVLIVGSVSICMAVADHNKKAVEIEAIRAGLVQDKDGHWVKAEQSP